MMRLEFLHLLVIFTLVALPVRVLGLSGCNITSVYQFGDSITDTGNFIRLAGPNNPNSEAARYPYGETFGEPTGRYSNGLLIIDYFAKALGLPLINPILANNVSFANGAVFSVAGATVQNVVLLAERNVTPAVFPDISLDDQLAWFRIYLASICLLPTDCAAKLKTSVIFIGEIGANDFNYAFLRGQSIEQVTTDVPWVVREIINSAREILLLGATKMVVLGNYPLGCLPLYLTMFQTTNSSAYDHNGCLIAYNDLLAYQNYELKQALTNLRTEFPNATIIYGDNYNAFEYVLNNAASLGFDTNSTLKACCGIGGQYNYNSSMMCGTSTYNLCPNPTEYISWDGIHFSQQAYFYITQYLIREIFPQLSCSVNASMY